jgi:hypothetical protein
MKVPKWIPILFIIAALYDGVLGVWFLLLPESPFRICDVTPPNHVGYVQFPAALLLIFALMFLSIARAPLARRGLIPYGILLKVAYCGVSGWHWLASGIPTMWKPFTIIDVVMAALFVSAYVILTRPAPATTEA